MCVCVFVYIRSSGSRGLRGVGDAKCSSGKCEMRGMYSAVCVCVYIRSSGSRGLRGGGDAERKFAGAKLIGRIGLLLSEMGIEPTTPKQ